MDEFFLHFLWQFQKFANRDLKLTTGESLSVFYPGSSNPNAGPDFLEAKIKLDGLEWMGSIEIHYQSSDWLLHKHSANPAYQNVILHVVWKHDKDIMDPSGKPLPTFSLAHHADPNLETEYRRYINQPEVIRCKPWLPGIPEVKKISLMDKALAERLKEKAEIILQTHQENQNDWEETAYQYLAKSFGLSVNQQPFLSLAKSLPYKILKKHLDQPTQLDALIFGQAGFLEDTPVDDYQANLKKEHDFLAKKYGLATSLTRFQWKYSRLRPANFPTVRLAQFSAFLHRHSPLFSALIEAKPIPDLELNGYWKTHFDFGKTLHTGENHFGESIKSHLSINLKAQLMAANSIYLGNPELMEAATTLLTNLKPEHNKITKAWEEAGITAQSAFDSQALIQQYKHHCEKKKCIRCTVGMGILNR